MKHIGKVFEYYHKKGYGFILTYMPITRYKTNENGMKVKAGSKDNIFFHITDCSFAEARMNDWVTYEVHERAGKTKAVNVKKIDIITDLDYLFDNWSDYNTSLQKALISDLERIFSYGRWNYISYLSNDSDFCERYTKFSRLADRIKLINTAKKIKDRLDLAGKLETERLARERKECKEREALNTELDAEKKNAEEVAKNAAKEAAEKAAIKANESASLNYFIFSVLERASIGESAFVERCKSIIDKNLHQEFEKNFTELDNSITTLRENLLSKLTTREELYPAVTSYLRGIKPVIKYRYTFEEGYSYTRWKWDGSEDSYQNPKSSSIIECSFLEKFAFKGMQIWWGYSRNYTCTYRAAKMSKSEVFLEVNSNLHNSRKFWNEINDYYVRIRSDYHSKETKMHKQCIANIFHSALTEIKQYLTLEFPLYGKTMYEWVEDWTKNLSYPMNVISDYILLKAPLSQDIETLIESSKKEPPGYVNRPNITGVNVVELKYKILDIYSYLYRNLLHLIESRNNSQNHINAFNEEKLSSFFTKGTIISAFDKEIIYRNNMTLSSDEKTLLCIDKNSVEVEIPSSVTHINDGALDGCINLKKISFLGPIYHIGHHVFNGHMLDIAGDFSHLSFLGYNNSSSKITINGTTQTITEWSYQYNKKEIDNADIKIEDIYIKQEDRC